jgi:hypothetical protein
MSQHTSMRTQPRHSNSNAKEGQADYHQPKPTPRLPVPTQRDGVDAVFDVS